MGVLGRKWTLDRLSDYMRNIAKEISPEKIQEPMLWDMINTSIDDIAEALSSAGAPDYGYAEAVSFTNTLAYSTNVITGAAYASATKTITSASHDISTSNVGNTIVYWDTSDDLITISTITDITTNTIVVADDAGADMTAVLFCVWGASTPGTSIDIANLTYAIDKIIKVVDSANGLCVQTKDLDFENIENIYHKQSNVFFNHFGESLYFFKGSSVSAYGTITVYYYRQPIWADDADDYLDIKDKYVPLVQSKVKAMIYEQTMEAPPEALTNLISNQMNQIRRGNFEELQAIRSYATPKGEKSVRG